MSTQLERTRANNHALSEFDMHGTEEEQSSFCQGHSRFTRDSAVEKFWVQHETIVLQHDPDVFPPSAFGLRFAEHIDFRGCHRAADIGTGTGFLAILAAKKGVPVVEATDVSKRAVEVAAYNASQLNEIDWIGTRQGLFFCDLAGTFDVITANLPQEILPPGYRNRLSLLQSQAVDGGGSGGNAVLLQFLKIVPSFMHATTRLYIIVNTVTDYKKTMRYVNDQFESVLVWQGAVRAKEFVRDNREFFAALIDAGTVSLVEDAFGDWHATQFIYQLTLKPVCANAL